MLRRATYPQIWDRRGYPESPSIPSLEGAVIHESLERVIEALAERGCEASDADCGFEVMKSLGGFTSIVASLIEHRMAALETNPRVRDRVGSLRQALLLRLPDMRQRVQSVVAMTEILPRSSGTAEQQVPSETRSPLPEGSYAEVQLDVPELELTGRADLVTIRSSGVEIMDYKTGSREDDHQKQLRTYALLWNRDAKLNPSGSRANRLTLRYPSGDEVVAAPSENELLLLEYDIRERTKRSAIELAKRPPPARPAAETCKGCSVRHLCPEYWDYLEIGGQAIVEHASELQFGDVEMKVLRRHGPRSWLVECERGVRRGVTAILRTTSESTTFPLRARQRVLNAAIGRDDDSGLVVLTQTSMSEVFQLE
jgi:CRISPR/Cas system-associated exonuclease Cas4 (RecB family)